jgi:hypothetical protein
MITSVIADMSPLPFALFYETTADYIRSTKKWKRRLSTECKETCGCGKQQHAIWLIKERLQYCNENMQHTSAIWRIEEYGEGKCSSESVLMSKYRTHEAYMLSGTKCNSRRQGIELCCQTETSAFQRPMSCFEKKLLFLLYWTIFHVTQNTDPTWNFLKH